MPERPTGPESDSDREPAHDSTRDPSREPGSDRVIALFVTVTWAAVVFAVDGLISAVLDRDPITGQVSPYYGILALLLAAVLLWFVLAGTARSRVPWFGAVGAIAGVYLVLVGSALPVGVVLAGQQAGSPFVLAAALIAGLTVIAMWAVLRRIRLQG